MALRKALLYVSIRNIYFDATQIHDTNNTFTNATLTQSQINSNFYEVSVRFTISDFGCRVRLTCVLCSVFCVLCCVVASVYIGLYSVLNDVDCSFVLVGVKNRMRYSSVASFASNLPARLDGLTTVNLLFLL